MARKLKAIKPDNLRAIGQQKIKDYMNLLKKMKMNDQEIRTMLVLLGQDVLYAACVGATISAAEAVLEVVVKGILSALENGESPQ